MAASILAPSVELPQFGLVSTLLRLCGKPPRPQVKDCLVQAAAALPSPGNCKHAARLRHLQVCSLCAARKLASFLLNVLPVTQVLSQELPTQQQVDVLADLLSLHARTGFLTYSSYRRVR